MASVVNGYTFEGSVNLGGTTSSNDAVQGGFFSFGTTGKYTDRLTITYAPINRNHWFWIDDRDFKSKRTFAFLMVLLSLTETGGKVGLPLVTIPAS